MQKIVVKNFGPIENAEIEIKKIVVLIGEQASGKSTIAKLIYFFKSLGDEVFKSFYKSDKSILDLTNDVSFVARYRFYDLFGSTMHLPNFEITFYFNSENDKFISLSLDNRKRLKATRSEHFNDRRFLTYLSERKRQIQSIETRLGQVLDVREEVALNADKTRYIQEISDELNQMFENSQNRHFYIIAGRESTVSYQTTFESYLEKYIQDLVDINRKNEEKEQAIAVVPAQAVDEVLMLDFIREVRRVKEVFRKGGGSFRRLHASSNERAGLRTTRGNSQQSLPAYMPVFIERLSTILKGNYEIDGWGEKIRHSENSYTNLKDASSGQKEAIRILQIIFLAILENQRGFQVVEEPEAHLFPVAQKALVELLVLMANHMPESQLIITTHSPYVLTVINNLLFSSRVVNKNPALTEQVDEIVPAALRIDPAQFSAYSFGNSFYPESSPCESIFNEETGAIRQNYLDIVSEMLGADFNRLYRMHAQSFAPRPA